MSESGFAGFLDEQDEIQSARNLNYDLNHKK